MKKLIFITLFIASIAYAAPTTQNFVNIQPFTDNTYNNGASANAWLDTFTYGLKFSTTTGGCLQSSSSGRVFMTGTNCGTGGTPAFTPTYYGASTSTIIGFLNGLFSTASSTFSTLYLTSLSQGSLYIGSSGLVQTIATSTLSGSGVISVTSGAYTLGGSPITISCPTCGTGTVTSVTASYPIVSSGGNTPNLTFTGLATTSPWTQGQVAWVVNNNTVSSVATGTVSSSGGITTTANRSVLGGSLAIGCTVADSSNAGCLSSTDWSTFNGKATFPFTVNVGYNSTTSTIGFIGGGLFSTASSTFSSNLFLSSIGQGFLYTGSNGLVNKIASSSIQLSWFTNDSGFITSATSPFDIATTSDIALSQLAYISKTTGKTTLASVATGTISGTNGITVTAGRSAVGGSLAIDCTVGSLSAAGCISIVNSNLYNNKVGTSTNETQGQLGVWTTTNGTPPTLGKVATTTLTGTAPIVFSQPISVIGGSASVITCNTASGSQSGCLSSADWTTFNSKLGSYDPFTHSTINLNNSATTSKIAIGTTTPYYSFTVASTTGAQIALSDGTSGVNQWAFRNSGGNLYIATTSVDGQSTSSPPAISALGATGSAGYFFGTTSNSAATGIAANGRMFLSGLTASAGLQTGILCLNSNNEVINESVACVASSKRFKKNILPLQNGLNELLKLKPVSYYYTPEYNGNLQSNPNYNGEQVGFVAEDVKDVDSRLVIVETEGDHKGEPHTVRYENITAIITQAVKELNSKVNYLYLIVSLLIIWNLYLTKKLWKN